MSTRNIPVTQRQQSVVANASAIMKQKNSTKRIKEDRPHRNVKRKHNSSLSIHDREGTLQAVTHSTLTIICVRTIRRNKQANEWLFTPWCWHWEFLFSWFSVKSKIKHGFHFPGITHLYLHLPLTVRLRTRRQTHSGWLILVPVSFTIDTGYKKLELRTICASISLLIGLLTFGTVYLTMLFCLIQLTRWI